MNLILESTFHLPTIEIVCTLHASFRIPSMYFYSHSIAVSIYLFVYSLWL